MNLNSDHPKSARRSSRKRARIKDVAFEAGVSVSTVNRVLSRSTTVSETTMQRVLRAAVKMEYVLDASVTASMLAKPMQLVFLLPSSNNRFIGMLADYVGIVEKTFAPLSIKCKVQFHEALSASDLSKSLLKHGQRADGIAFIALDQPIVREAVNRLADSGRHVLTLVSDLPDSRRVAYVGVNNCAAGRTAGYLMGRLVGDRSGKLMLIAGSLNYRGHQEREAGFRQVLEEEFPHLQIVGLREAQDDPGVTHRLTRSLLRQNPDLLGIYNIGGGPDGVGRALKEAQLEKHVIFIGHEITSETRTFLADGTLDAIINQSAQIEVLNAIRVFTNLRDGKSAKAGIEDVRIGIFVKENLP